MLELVVAPAAPLPEELLLLRGQRLRGGAVRQPVGVFVYHGKFPAELVQKGEPGAFLAPARQLQHRRPQEAGGDRFRQLQGRHGVFPVQSFRRRVVGPDDIGGFIGRQIFLALGAGEYVQPQLPVAQLIVP